MDEVGVGGDAAHTAGVRRARWGRRALIAVVVLSVASAGAVLAQSRGSSDAGESAPIADDVARSGFSFRLTPQVPDAGYEPQVVQSGRGMELFESLPAEVGSFSLMDVSAVALPGALEAYSGTYTDPGAPRGVVVVTVGRWATEADAARLLVTSERDLADGQARRVRDLGKLGVAGDAPGEVLAFREAGDLTIVWSDFTTAGRIEGKAAEVREVFAQFRLGPDAGADQE